MTRRSRGRLAGIAGFALFALGCATNPVTGRRELNLVSSSQEEGLGREGYKAMLVEYGGYGEGSLQSYVDSVGQRLASVSHLPNLKWTFTVLDDPVVNAFAMPGGYVYVTRGILAHLGSEAQLAGVLGHEIGHVTARHSAQRITQSQLAGLGLGLASVVSPGFARYGNLAETALSLVFLKYGRDDEHQADELGVEYAVKANYDPREIPGTYEMLSRIGAKSGSRLPEFLSTHPDPGNRLERTAALARTAVQGQTGLVVGSRGYLMRLDGTVYGEDPRQGYFEGRAFHHPGLRFEMQFPDGWQHRNTRQAVLSAAPGEKGLQQLTLVPDSLSSPADFVAQLERSRRILGSEGRSETIGGYRAWVGRLAVQGQGETQVVLVAGFIRKSPDQFFQILGRGASGAEENQIFQSIRSFSDLKDPARLSPTPSRVRVRPAPAAGTFESVIDRLGSPGADLEAVGILNQTYPDRGVLSGELIKTVEAGRKQ